jgi:NTE family protein
MIKEKGVYKSDPLLRTIKSYLDGKSPQRHVYVGSVNLNSGEYKVFNSISDWPIFAEAIVASASAPGFLPPTEISGELWFDGGTAFNVELPAIVDHCRSRGYHDN